MFYFVNNDLLSIFPQGITERLARKNAFLTRAKLKEYLSSGHAPSSKKEEFAMTRLKELRGEKTGDEQRWVYTVLRGFEENGKNVGFRFPCIVLQKPSTKTKQKIKEWRLMLQFVRNVVLKTQWKRKTSKACCDNQDYCFNNLFLYFTSRPKSRPLGVKTGLKSPKELLQRQVNNLEGKVDNLNAELAQVMKTESELNNTVNQMEGDNNVPEDRLAAVIQQLTNAELHKNNLLKKVDYLEDEIRKKTKELNALNSQRL